MEYEGAGSFWAQLTSTEDISGVMGLAPRKIDDLLRNPDSSLLDILSDEEAISEFRSSNASIVSRLTDLHGMNFIVNLITNRDIPEGMSTAQTFQLPYIATELVACEVDAMLDAFPRSVPGRKSPLDQLMRVILEEHEGATVMGYVVRVLNILITRRPNFIDQYISTHSDFSRRVRELIFDRSIADLLIRLLIEDDIKSFSSSFSLLSLVPNTLNVDMNESVLSVFQAVLNRSMVSSDRMELVWDQIKADIDGLDRIISLIGTSFGDEILRILVIFAFSRGQTAAVSFNISTTLKPVEGSDDGCLFDEDETPQYPTARQISAPGISRWGQSLVDRVIDSILLSDNLDVSALADRVAHLRLCTALLRHTENRKFVQYAATAATQAIFEFPQSSALHTVVQALLLLAIQINADVAQLFLTQVAEKEVLPSFSGHVCKISAACNDATSMVEWSRINTRLTDMKGLSDRQTEWAKLDFAAFPVHVRNISDPEDVDIKDGLKQPLGDMHPLDRSFEVDPHEI